jgi:hypothetical protein
MKTNPGSGMVLSTTETVFGLSPAKLNTRS